MRPITHKNIEEWIDKNNRKAQGTIPLLISRLVAAAPGVFLPSIPHGDNIQSPGWDGQMFMPEEYPHSWIPSGKSFWEIGCDKKIGAKAQKDYEKRTYSASMSAEDRSKSTFVFVTPRRFGKKKNLEEEKKAEGKWKDIKVYDGEDLAEWLAKTLPVNLWFAEQIGLSGNGIESPEAYWKNWATQTDPKISLDAFLYERSKEQKKLLDLLHELKQTDKNEISRISIIADNKEEAVAFVCATLMNNTELRRELNQAAIITAESGWKFVEQESSSSIKIAITTDSTHSEKLPNIDNERALIIVTPFNGTSRGKVLQ